MFENYPAYLVPDTNCFVDHLDGLRAIVASQAFTLVVPLIGKTVLLQIVSVYVNIPRIAWRSRILKSPFSSYFQLLLGKLRSSIRWGQFVNSSLLNIAPLRGLMCAKVKPVMFCRWYSLIAVFSI